MNFCYSCGASITLSEVVLVHKETNRILCEVCWKPCIESCSSVQDLLQSLSSGQVSSIDVVVAGQMK